MLQRLDGLLPPVSCACHVGSGVFLGPAGLPTCGQHSEFTSVLAASAQGQENAEVLRAEGRLADLLNVKRP